MDRFSWLPDEVICHILSFLPTKLSVQTSVLSKRWRFIWVHVPFLEFNCDDTRIVNIITKVVLQHKHNINTFRLSIGDLEDDIEEEVESWIVNITKRNIHNLSIALEDSQFRLPQCIFNCEHLVDLSLDNCGDIPESGIYFPALKNLNLECVVYESHEPLDYLISCCPVLEELSVQGKWDGHCCVSSPTLTKLVLNFNTDEFSNFGMNLDTPSLRYLWLCCAVPDILSVGALDSLVEAEIDIYWSERHQENFTYSRCVLALVSKLYNVKVLTLSTHRIAMIHDSVFSALTLKFHNLTELDLCSNLGFITIFLENANNLQVLKFRIITRGDDIDNQYGWTEPEQVPACLISNLQTVILCSFGCSGEEFDFVSYILMNANVLKMMEIRAHLHTPDWKEKIEALDRFAIERGSQDCKLVFDRDNVVLKFFKPL